MIRVLKRVLPSLPDSSSSVVECRRCGTNLDSEDVECCPECGSSEVAVFEL
jgi:rRNA maturation endonuclease Nob1